MKTKGFFYLYLCLTYITDIYIKRRVFNINKINIYIRRFIFMLGDATKIYQERRAKIKSDLLSNPWLLDGVRIFSEDSYNFVRLTDFSYFGISDDEFLRVLSEVKEEEEIRISEEKRIKKEKKKK